MTVSLTVELSDEAWKQLHASSGRRRRRLARGEKLLTTVLARNKELREERDWENMKGRAVL